MDENSSPVSTPSSTNSSPIHHTSYDLISPLQAKTNKARYEVLSDTKKHSTTISSPVRSPLSDKNASTIISPHQHKQRPLSPVTKHSPTLTKQPSTKRTTDSTTSDKPFIKSPSPSPSSCSSSSSHDQLQITEIQTLQQELDSWTAKVRMERQRSAAMLTWEKTMTDLIQQYKKIQLELDDTVDILVDYEKVSADLAKDEALVQEKQRQVDLLMNLVPERIFKIQELKQQLGQ
ncbi:hypothetical protein BC941DRAFT_48704 [Chlamydoabsidia padenii]|nr:hypothetical protein BC941DRAFT_48704 [Chlamydoabsidia padenii]